MAPTDASPDLARIDHEIANLQRQISYYKHHRALLTATALARPHLQTNAAAAASPKLRARIEQQRRLSLESAYRLGAGITAFRVRDPDPAAVDGGRVLGVRIEVFDARRASFGAPYYVFLNRPEGGGGSGQGAMRVHKHTLPPYVGLRAIVGRLLPYHGEGAQERQDVVRFARAVRRELVAAMKRRCAVETLAAEAEQVQAFQSVRAKDIEAREAEIKWRNGTVGRVKLGKDGQVEGVYVAAADGARQTVAEAAVKDGDGRVEGIVQRLLKAGTL